MKDAAHSHTASTKTGVTDSVSRQQSANSILSAALETAALGYAVFPLAANSKAPVKGSDGLHDATTDRDRIRRALTNGRNYGTLPPENVLALDCDDADQVGSLEARFPELAEAPAIDTPRGGRHWYLRTDGWRIPTRAKAAPGLDVRGFGRAYVAGPGSRIDGKSYAAVRPLVAPEALPVASKALREYLTPEASAPPARRPPDAKPSATRASGYARAAWDAELARVASAPEGNRNDTLNSAAFNLGQLVGAGHLDRDRTLAALVRAAGKAGLSDSEAAQTAKSGLSAGRKQPRHPPEREMTAGQALDRATTGYQPPVNQEKSEGKALPDLTKFRRSDYGNAERLFALYGHDLRHCTARGWLVWDGKRWHNDSDEKTLRRLALQTARQLFRQASRLEGDQRDVWIRHSLACERRASLANAVELAKTLPGASVEVDELDSDPMLLNVENGTVDLRSGKLRPHSRSDLITKLAPVPYDPEAKCPQWLGFQRTICAGDSELIAFKQRAVGYSLTGSSAEQVLFIAYGAGANGKTTELHAIGQMLGDYATSAQFDTFAVKRNEAVRDDIADLAGARLVSASEGEGRHRLAEGLVKQLTGGDPVKARFLYRDYFAYRPQFKLWLATNYKPFIRGTTWAIWRRIRLIPYTVVIPDERQDKSLPAKLEGELAGILAWAVRGCLDWQRHGLGHAEAVTDATNAYRSESDTLGDFIAARCVVGEAYTELAGALYTAYREFAEQNGDEPVSSPAFGRLLTERGHGTSTARRGGKPVKVRGGLALAENAVREGV